MGGINKPKPVPCTAHLFSGDARETVDLKLSIHFFSAQGKFSEFLTLIDQALLEERRKALQVSALQLTHAAAALGKCIDDLGFTILFSDLYVQSLRNERTPSGYLKGFKKAGGAKSSLLTVVRKSGYEAGLAHVRRNVSKLLVHCETLASDIHALIKRADKGTVEKDITFGSSRLKKNCCLTARKWSQVNLDFVSLAETGHAVYRQFYKNKKQ